MIYNNVNNVTFDCFQKLMGGDEREPLILDPFTLVDTRPMSEPLGQLFYMDYHPMSSRRRSMASHDVFIMRLKYNGYFYNNGRYCKIVEYRGSGIPGWTEQTIIIYDTVINGKECRKTISLDMLYNYWTATDSIPSRSAAPYVITFEKCE